MNFYLLLAIIFGFAMLAGVLFPLLMSIDFKESKMSSSNDSIFGNVIDYFFK